MSCGDYRLDPPAPTEPECARHRGEAEADCALCAEERAATCDTCGGTRLVTVEVAAYSLTWGCHCDDGARESRPPIAAE